MVHTVIYNTDMKPNQYELSPCPQIMQAEPGDTAKHPDHDPEQHGAVHEDSHPHQAEGKD